MTHLHKSMSLSLSEYFQNDLEFISISEARRSSNPGLMHLRSVIPVAGKLFSTVVESVDDDPDAEADWAELELLIAAQQLTDDEDDQSKDSDAGETDSDWSPGETDSESESDEAEMSDCDCSDLDQSAFEAFTQA